MKLVRPAVAVATGAALVLAGNAGAATKPKPVCNLVTDATGDGSFIATPNSAALDVVSADIATSKNNVTVVIRTAGMASDPQTTLGKEYKFSFVAGGVEQFLRVQSLPGLGETYDYGDQSGTNGGSVSKGQATGAIDTTANTVTITAPKSEFVGLKGGKASSLVARSYISLGAAYEVADTAEGSASYKDLTPSCLKP